MPKILDVQKMNQSGLCVGPGVVMYELERSVGFVLQNNFLAVAPLSNADLKWMLTSGRVSVSAE